MTNEELKKYLQMMNSEYGQRGYTAGMGPPDMYGNQAISGEEGWGDIIKDQLRTNQFGDQSPNLSFAERGLPSNMGLLNSREEAEQVLGHRLEDNPGQFPALDPRSGMRTDGVPVGPPLLSEAPFNNQLEAWGQTSDPYAFHTQDSLKDYIPDNFPDTSLGLPSASAIPAASSSLALEAGPSGYPSLAASGAESALPYAGEGVSEGLAAETAASGSSSWGGPETFAANMALNMLPTRDRDKVDTPLGDEGSYSGILKGTGKGALTAATLSGGNPYATAAGAVLGAYGGTQGYFDSTSAPQINIGRVKRGRGMPQGLLGGGSMYG